MKMTMTHLFISLSLVLTSTASVAGSLSLTSPAFQDNDSLPITYTCDGDRLSPPFEWQGVSSDAKSLAFIMDHLPQPRVDDHKGDGHNDDKRKEETHAGDDKKPADEEGLRWYWGMYNIPTNETQINAGESIGTLGSNVVNHHNEYAPPCSKGPGEKRYSFHLYALSDTLSFSASQEVTESVLRDAMKGLILDSASLSVTFERSGQTDAPQKPSEPPQINVPSLENSVDSEACSAVKKSVIEAGFDDVTVTCDNTYAYVQSDTYPDHSLMNGIIGTNEQIPVPALNYAAPILLHPHMADHKTSIDAAVGVAVNGVPIYDYSAQGELDPEHYDPKQDTILLGQLDECGGHAGRGDDYHYHAKPTCMIDSMDKVTDASIIGWGYDGFPLYGDANPDGSAITEGVLDVCNGQADDQFGYRYHTSDKPPYIIQCLVGEVDTKILPRVAPLSGDDARANLTPPQNGVENLLHTIDENGTRSMTYTYKGVEYYSRYTPSKTAENCFEFEQKTVSNHGKVESGTYCR
ncbi:MAG: YHYH protein [Marinomonas sp.]